MHRMQRLRPSGTSAGRPIQESRYVADDDRLLPGCERLARLAPATGMDEQRERGFGACRLQHSGTSEGCTAHAKQYSGLGQADADVTWGGRRLARPAPPYLFTRYSISVAHSS
jgi:hypothetical protein